MAASNVPDDLQLVSRLACLGSEDGTFHVLKKREYSPDQTESIKSILSMNRSQEVIKRLKTIANQKCYVKRENLLFSLANIIETFNTQDDNHKNDSICKEAYGLVQDLCETPSDLFTFVNFNKQIRSTSKASWGRGMRNLISTWYESKPPHVLAKHITQCKSGHGFSHKDLIKQTHINCDGKSKGTGLVLNYLLKGKSALDKMTEAGDDEEIKKVVSVLESVEKLRWSQESEKELIRSLIETNSLEEKQIPTHFFRLRETFEGLLGHMPLTSLVKSVPRMATLGILDPMSSDVQRVLDRLTDAQAIKQAKLNPVTTFIAMRKYDDNRFRKWIRNVKMAKALRNAYNLSLENVINTGKRYLLAIHLDAKPPKASVTGSGSTLAPIMPPTILIQILSRIEKNPTFVYFTSPSTRELNMSPSMATTAILEQLLSRSGQPNNDSYDICDPLKWATEQKKAYDCILIVCGKKKLASRTELQDALSKYRTESQVPDAKVAIIGLSDPTTAFPSRDDLNFLDVTGFNEDVPNLVQQFFKGLPQ